MRASDVLLKSIRRFEGFRGKAYQDAKGVWTIGYGHTTQVKEGDIVTRKEAEQLLCDDLQIFENYVNSLNICGDNQFHFDALTDFAYNCGIILRISTLVHNNEQLSSDRHPNSKAILPVAELKSLLPVPGAASGRKSYMRIQFFRYGNKSLTFI